MPVFLTYNTWKCDGDYPQRLARIAPELSASDADIIFLQEVFRSEDTAYDTLETLGLNNDECHLMTQPGRHKTRAVGNLMVESYSNLVIASRHTPTAQGSFYLPGHTEDPHRHCLWIRCHIDGIDLVAVNTHLTHIASGANLRRRQFARIREFCNHCDCDLVVVGGDLNANPDDLNPENDTRTCFTPPFPSTLNGERQACFDHFHLFDRKATGFTFDATQTLWHGEDSDTWASDHRGVLTRVINGPATGRGK
jgi:endonuclease/exonuclease/phosphatase family metal-dependent hydrolase